jgi:hypothetical protein
MFPAAKREGPKCPPKIEKDGRIETFYDSLVVLKHVFETFNRGDREIFFKY